MTTQTEALKMALEALENNKQTHYYCEDTWYSCPQHEDGCANDSVGDECNCGADKANAEIDKAITAIKEALAQPEPEQEPVAWGVFEGNLHDMFFTQVEAVEMVYLKGTHAEVKPLYTTTPQRTWVGLTDDEEMDIALEQNKSRHWVVCEAIRQFKEKNQ